MESLSARQSNGLDRQPEAAALGLLHPLRRSALARSPQLVAFTPPEASPTTQGSIFCPHPTICAPVESADSMTQNYSSAHAQLVKAVMPRSWPASRSHAIVRPGRIKPAIAAHEMLYRAKKRDTQCALRHYVEPQQAWVVMTEWTDMDAAPQVVFAVARDNRGAGKQAQGRKISYAAVPFANGWLIVRI